MESSSKQNEELELLPPLSPISKSLNSSVIDLNIITVFEFETLITKSEILDFIRSNLSITPRFSSIIENDKNGVPRWKKVEFHCEDHLVIPTFPSDLQSREDFDKHLREYVAKVGCEKFPKSRPMWEVHLIKYPSLNGVSSMLMKTSHAVGDGYSLAKILFFALKKASNPSLSLSIPQLSMRSDGEGMRRKYLGFFTKCMNTVSDFTWSWLKGTIWKDSATVIRSGRSAESEFIRPIDISCLTLSLAQLKQIKSKLGATMNDVIMGIISYMIHLYMVKKGQISYLDSSMTILVMVNMRAILQGYKSLDEMLKYATWGNHSRFLPVPIPTVTDIDKVNPLDFIIQANQIMKRKKNSMSLLLIDPVLKAVRSIKGQQGLDELVHMSLNNASTMITNLVGPEEQMAVGKNPVSSFYFLVTGIPQSLTFTSVSCMGELKLVATMEKGFIDSQLFTSCMNEASENILEAALAPIKKSN